MNENNTYIELNNNLAYIGEAREDGNYAFDEDYYSMLVDSQRFYDAAAYLRNYQFIGSNKDEANAKWDAEISALDDKALRQNGMMRRIENRKDAELISFADLADGINGFDGVKASYHKHPENFESERPSVAKAMKLAEEFCTCYYVNEYGKHMGTTKADRVEITFPAKQVNVFGLDLNKKDNVPNDREFFDRLGVDPEKSDSVGLNRKVDNVTGDVTVSFSPDNRYIYKIMENLPEYNIFENEDNKHKIRLYKDGKLMHQLNSTSSIDIFSGINSDKYEALTNGRETSSLEYKRMLKKARRKRDSYTSSDKYDEVYSATTFSLETDRMKYITNQYNNNLITLEQYKSLINSEREKDLSVLKALDWYQAGIYITNDSGILEKANDSDVKDVFNRFCASDIKNVDLAGYTTGMETGILITLPPIKATNGTIKQDATKIYIPRVLVNRTQAAIYNDTKIKSINTYNNMYKYDGYYKCIDGNELSLDNKGCLLINNNLTEYPVSKDDIIRMIDEDLILKDSRRIKFNYINANGDLDDEAFKENIKRYAFIAGEELYPDIDLRLIRQSLTGGKLNYNDIFDIDANEFNNYVDIDVYNKILKIRDIYNKIYNEARAYIIDR